MEHVIHITQASAQLKRLSMAADKNIRYVSSDEETVTFLKLTHT